MIQHLPREMSVSEARGAGFLERTSKSQLMVISDAEYESGLKRIDAADVVAEGTEILRSDLPTCTPPSDDVSGRAGEKHSLKLDVRAPVAS